MKEMHSTSTHAKTLSSRLISFEPSCQLKHGYSFSDAFAIQSFRVGSHVVFCLDTLYGCSNTLYGHSDRM